jgi:hypothetical protein
MGGYRHEIPCNIKDFIPKYDRESRDARETLGIDLSRVASRQTIETLTKITSFIQLGYKIVNVTGYFVPIPAHFAYNLSVSTYGQVSWTPPLLEFSNLGISTWVFHVGRVGRNHP